MAHLLESIKQERGALRHSYSPLIEGDMDKNGAVLLPDTDTQGFSITRKDVEEALSGGTGDVRVLDTSATIGTARLSASGRALSGVINGKLHTVPLKLLMLVQEGKQRELALFVGV